MGVNTTKMKGEEGGRGGGTTCKICRCMYVSLWQRHSPISTLDPVLDGSEYHLAMETSPKHLLHRPTLVLLQYHLVLLSLVRGWG